MTNQVKEEKKVMGSGRKQTELKQETTPKREGKAVGTTPAPALTRVLGATRDRKWYLKHEGEFADVTSEATNSKLGINMISVFQPSEGQMNAGTIANVRIDTVIGTISSLQIRESKERDGSIYLSEPSRNIAKQDQEARWLNDVKLTKQVQAQILSYIETLLVDAK